MISQLSKAGKLGLGLFLIVAALSSVARPVAAQTGMSTIPIMLIAFDTAFSLDGKTLAIVADRNLGSNTPALSSDILPIHLVDIASGKETAQLAGTQTDFTTGMAFAPDSKRLVSLHSNGQMNVWDVSGSKLVKSYQLPGLAFVLPKFLADGQHIMVINPTTPDHILTIDTANGAITANYGRQGISSGFGIGDFSYSTFDISPDGKTLAAATLNDEVDLWDTATGKMSALVTPADKKPLIDIRPLVFTPDGKALVYFHRTDNKLHIIDLAIQQERKIGVTGGQSFALNAKGDQIAWVDKSQVYTWDFQAAQPTKVADLDPKFKVVSVITRLFFTPDNTQLIVSGLTASDGNNQIFIIPLVVPKS